MPRCRVLWIVRLCTRCPAARRDQPSPFNWRRLPDPPRRFFPDVTEAEMLWQRSNTDHNIKDYPASINHVRKLYFLFRNRRGQEVSLPIKEIPSFVNPDKGLPPFLPRLASDPGPYRPSLSQPIFGRSIRQWRNLNLLSQSPSSIQTRLVFQILHWKKKGRGTKR